jgi:hypothetical protein
MPQLPSRAKKSYGPVDLSKGPKQMGPSKPIFPNTVRRPDNSNVTPDYKLDSGNGPIIKNVPKKRPR